MAEGRITTGVISGLSGLAAGTVLGGFLGRGGFFGEGAGTSGVVTPGGAIGADAQASVAAGRPADAPLANGAIRYPTSPADAVKWAKQNPALAVGVGLVLAFVVYKLVK